VGALGGAGPILMGDDEHDFRRSISETYQRAGRGCGLSDRLAGIGCWRVPRAARAVSQPVTTFLKLSPPGLRPRYGGLWNRAVWPVPNCQMFPNICYGVTVCTRRLRLRETHFRLKLCIARLMQP
jgi:hypothetical protein